MWWRLTQRSLLAVGNSPLELLAGGEHLADHGVDHRLAAVAYLARAHARTQKGGAKGGAKGGPKGRHKGRPGKSVRRLRADQ